VLSFIKRCHLLACDLDLRARTSTYGAAPASDYAAENLSYALACGPIPAGAAEDGRDLVDDEFGATISSGTVAVKSR